MSRAIGMGQSSATLDKQVGFSCILQQHMAATKSILKKYHWARPVYWYVDMNAGCGYNERVQCVGSPIIFLEAAKRFQIDFRAFLIEQDAELADALVNRIASDYKCLAHPPCRIKVGTGDNRILTPQICQILQKWDFGLIYHDPNGQWDVDLVSSLSESLETIDFLVRCSATAIKRNSYRTGRDFLSDIQKVHKKHLMIRQLDPSDPWHWTFLYFSNWGGLREWRSKGFVYANSAEGLKILERLALTNEEMKSTHSPRFQWEQNTEIIPST